MMRFADLGRGLFKYGKALSQKVANVKIPSSGPFSFRDIKFVTRNAPRFGRFIWRNRKPIIGVSMMGYAGWKAGQGIVQGYNTQVSSPEQMSNRASGYGPFGDEELFRNNGRMSSNHLGHRGLTLSLSRLRHGR